MPNLLKLLLSLAHDAATVRSLFTGIGVPTADVDDEHLMIARDVLVQDDGEFISELNQQLTAAGFTIVTDRQPDDRTFLFFVQDEEASLSNLLRASSIISDKFKGVSLSVEYNNGFCLIKLTRPITEKEFAIELIDCPSLGADEKTCAGEDEEMCSTDDEETHTDGEEPCATDNRRRRPYYPRECKECGEPEEKKTKLSIIFE
jgi:hypothetical protein